MNKPNRLQHTLSEGSNVHTGLSENTEEGMGRLQELTHIDGLPQPYNQAANALFEEARQFVRSTQSQAEPPDSAEDEE